MLAVVDACAALVERGVLATEIEELDFSAVLRAAQECPPDGVAEVLEHRDRMLRILEQVR